MFRQAKLLSKEFSSSSTKNSFLKIASLVAVGTMVFTGSSLGAKKQTTTNLLKDKNPQFFKAKMGLYLMDEGYQYSTDSHTKDGSGSAKLDAQGAAAYSKAITTPTFHVEKGKRYTVSAYIKMVGVPRGQNIFLKITPRGNLGKGSELLYNVSEPNQWEEAIMPFRPTESGDYVFSLFIHKYGNSTDGKLIKPDLSNMGKSPVLYYDDFSVIEADHVVSREPYTAKIPFNGDNVRIDKLGNWSVKEQGKWKAIFPRQTYQTWLPNFVEVTKQFKEYGFNGYANITNTYGLNAALAAGLKYNSIQINTLNNETKNFIQETIKLMKNGTIPPTSIIMFTHDNEDAAMVADKQKQAIVKWLNKNVPNAAGTGRAIPVFVLNGVGEGLARSQKSSHLDFMDVTGSYTDWAGQLSNQSYVPTDTLLLLDRIHNQKAPVSIIQLQSYYHKVFIPMLFKGIIGGGRALQFWRGGVTYQGSKKDFRENYWAPAIKGPNGVFAKIDKMLPIISEPLATDWQATIPQAQKDTIAIGKRTHKGKHYLILANFAKQDQNIKIRLSGVKVTTVKDYFTRKQLATVNANAFTVKIGHFNNGYKILILE